ncbi:hypothetical protein A3I27_03950 [Candidatus Giovannonibacteria bacterium RIFCSPLOWO2_02_FULL_43_11b]|uniref:Uncharacterized protein n=1 Tax=Candidatus Giovannonibacteria bacterium RIFCSPHIGHO2_12_FULL_43_15 TaxID=1798341 RepID=A0A1F5WQK8_9BACT|nr:MAG: hypothetical protein A3B97_04140 [Candidatus Giovannonibacteria bacterium RIFCSPHIGHO2_02_FULL_43_32]OGF77945.1 MAG: hypothetical protein A3F23_03840 [Candidatus Giovannonibacteria bacterium RIFCSPHIGHO2_12_FULL_43_15]OGF78291.1 MAG: hypothetical protein A3A15_03005 [Candidatus Giovannonibacteria bacterium RIFCSPLOWO2_01_FULL_43_60]OGF90289.1 MAG: hypothetical protein A3I27_03950 [Candidatus Giovannonibacteria bacterium RIFCSPLOWO2_02_FULL_43_11b]
MAQEAIHEDIKWLEGQLEAKKRELEGAGAETKEELEIIKDVIKEAPQAPTPPPASHASLSDDDTKKKAGELEEKKHHEIIDELVAIAFSKNLASALKVAESFKNPHIIDEFHDTLADQYYQKLQDARKLK